MNKARALTVVAAATTVLAGGLLTTATASAAVTPDAGWNSISATAGGFDTPKCESPTRHKTDAGSIKMSLNKAPVGELQVWLQNAKNGSLFAGPVAVNAGEGSPTLATGVLAGTEFHVCAASPAGAAGGPYNGYVYY